MKAGFEHLFCAATSAYFSRCTEGVLMLVDVAAEDRCTHLALHDSSSAASKRLDFRDLSL